MIRTERLVKRFDGDTAIRYKDLTFEAGQSYVLLGASGCGKSTLLNMLAGVITPSEGHVYFDDREVSSMPQREKDRFRIEKIGYIFQDFKLIEEMTAEDNINVLKLEGVKTDRMDEVLDALGILGKKKKKVSKLSGGERQRVAIARAFVKAPDIILADEPTGNLNYEIGSSVVRQMLDIARGKTLIAVTHDDRLAPLFDHVIDMNAVASSHAESEVGGDA
ncbi:MAG: ATP-binding cassette domain-containing protein [Oscillospiraceae bacterium]|nr:ATP-binding cassette domain-containing protein [Oscillospiraceae bacterium]